jgi:hypothetical protein
LDTTQPALQIEIDDQWYDLSLGTDDLIVNTGEPFAYLLPSVNPGKQVKKGHKWQLFTVC